jgi:hypothetical protein
VPPFTSSVDDQISFQNPAGVWRNVFFAVAGEAGQSTGAFDVTVDVAALP